MKPFANKTFSAERLLLASGLFFAIAAIVISRLQRATHQALQSQPEPQWASRIVEKIEAQWGSRSRDHAITATTATMKEVATFLGILIEENSDYPHAFGTGPSGEIQSRRVVQALLGKSLIPPILEAEAKKSGGRLTDSWGNELNFQVCQAGPLGQNTWIIAIWSNGPNRRNEKGLGDDILVQTWPLPTRR